MSAPRPSADLLKSSSALVFSLLAFTLLAFAPACSSPGGGKAARGPGGTLDPKVEDLMRTICDRVAATDAMSFTLVDYTDQLDGDMKITYGHKRDILLSRPDKVRVRTRGDRARRSFYKDSERITLVDHDHEVYAQLEHTGSVDEMMDMLWNKYGIATPLADMLSSDPYQVFMGDAVASRYVGLHESDDGASHHLVVALPYLEYQIWIGEADGLLKKMIISYPGQPGEPQYEVHVLDSRPVDQVDAAAFTAEIPEGFEQVDLAPLVAGN